ncbi:MAG: triose-phosphate isomerase [Thermaerobacter sp.]|nr:triose-phosphate isomerase [Thermaerobacter sp.]MBS4053570.1 triose-phosphate isomerase [Thermaerobacter sp.]
MALPLIIGNWKMHNSLAESEALLRQLLTQLDSQNEVEVCVCPPFTALALAGSLLKASNIKLGAQSCHHLESGAFTGEVSLPMLKELACQYVLVGHSERRQFFGETDSGVAAKVAAAVKHGLVPVLCIGEDLATRQSGRGESYVLAQLEAGLSLLSGPVDEVVIAYEPVWAIGTGQAATPAQANEMLRSIAEKTPQVADIKQVRLLYGGSVTAQNAAGFFAEEYVGGVLAGGVSLKAESFAHIVRLARR